MPFYNVTMQPAASSSPKAAAFAKAATLAKSIETPTIVLVSVLTIVAVVALMVAAFSSQHHLSPEELMELGLHHLLPPSQPAKRH